MNRGPISRRIKVPVKCKNCGKIKYNVVCENQIIDEKKEEKKLQEIPKEETEQINQTNKKTYKKPQKYDYIKAVVKKQNKIASEAYNKEKR